MKLTVHNTGDTCIIGVCTASSGTAKRAVHKSGLIPSTTNGVERDGPTALAKCCTRSCCRICK